MHGAPSSGKCRLLGRAGRPARTLADLGPDRLLVPRTATRRRETTDSERYFLAVSERLDAGATPAEVLRTTADAIAATARFTSLNCLLLTPEPLYAFCRLAADGPIEEVDPEYYTLRYRVTPDAVIVASSGWGTDWHDLADGDLLVVERHSLEVTVESTRPVLQPAR